MKHPFAELIDLRYEDTKAGSSTLALVVAPQHLNPHEVVHGAVLYALADNRQDAPRQETLASSAI